MVSARRELLLGDTLGKQAGAALIVSLIFIVVLTMLGVIAMQSSTMSERMAGNARDRNLAFQAAESALTDAVNDIQNSGRISGMTGATATCTNGLCCNVNGIYCVEPTTPVYIAFSMSAAPSVAYGTWTSAPALDASLSKAPRYLIEPFQIDNSETRYYRITARGYGVNQYTQVTLEKIHRER